MRLVALLLALLVAGCLEPAPPQGEPTIQDAVRDHVQTFIDGDVERYLTYYSDDWVDLGGGDGTPFTREERREKFQGFLASERWQAARARSPEDVLDVANGSYRAFGEYRSNASAWRGSYQPLPQDVEVALPPVEGSPLFDGWFGYYRPANGTWVQVAGD